MPRGGKTKTSGQGRPKGTPNKATSDARKAIGAFVDGNAHRLQEWLDKVAEGIKTQLVKDGKPVVDDKGNPVEVFVVEPNPEKAFSLFQSVVEYHVPKLARSEQTISGPDGGPVQMTGNIIINGK